MISLDRRNSHANCQIPGQKDASCRRKGTKCRGEVPSAILISSDATEKNGAYHRNNEFGDAINQMRSGVTKVKFRHAMTKAKLC